MFHTKFQNVYTCINIFFLYNIQWLNQLKLTYYGSVINEYISDNPFILLEQLIIGLLPLFISKSQSTKES